MLALITPLSQLRLKFDYYNAELCSNMKKLDVADLRIDFAQVGNELRSLLYECHSGSFNFTE
jgi:hypothetical protein